MHDPSLYTSNLRAGQYQELALGIGSPPRILRVLTREWTVRGGDLFAPKQDPWREFVRRVAGLPRRCSLTAFRRRAKLGPLSGPTAARPAGRLQHKAQLVSARMPHMQVCRASCKLDGFPSVVPKEAAP